MKKLLSGKWALVTGASSGLGSDFARILASMGAHLVISARREELLNLLKSEIQKQYQIEVLVIPMDLSIEDAPVRIFQFLKSKKIELDILINNAGFAVFGDFADLSWEKESQMLRLDILALVNMTKLFLKSGSYNKKRYILQLASIAAFQPSPMYASYSAAKSFVLNFSLAIRNELRKTSISCTALCPGVTRTEFFDVAEQKVTFFQRITMMDSQAVARAGIKAMLKRRSLIVPGIMNKIMALLTRFVSRPLQAKLARLFVQG
ncbi:MAG: SDR family oxidoreductase [Spirochaetales bacterium]|nr:SDR family oxidoreductase [Spirochaetales bacterium]